MRKLVIVGAGGHGREVLDVVEAINAVEPTFDFLGFLVDGPGAHEPVSRRAAGILGPVSLLESLSAAYAVAIGNPRARAEVDKLGIGLKLESPVLIHPRASIGSDVHLGAGSIVMAGGRITTNVVAGRMLHVNVNATISHDCRIGEYVTLSPGCHLSGTVSVGDYAYFGTGSVAIPEVKVGANTMIGAGAVVIRDVPDHATVVGVPARPISTTAAR